jgi:hypothetical protein
MSDVKELSLEELLALEADLVSDEDVEATLEADAAEDGTEVEDAPEVETEDVNPEDIPSDDEDAEDDDEVEEATFAALFLNEFATPDEIQAMAESYDEMATLSENMGVAMEKVIVKMDKKSRLTHLQKAAVFKLANAANDPKYRKLLTLWKQERQIEAYLNKKYASKASKIAKAKIKNYTATGLKKVAGDPKKEVGKGKIADKVAARAVEQTKKSFSNK